MSLPQQSVNFCRQRSRRLRGSAPFSLLWTAIAAVLFAASLGAISLYGASLQRQQTALLTAAEQAIAKQTAELAALRHLPLPATDPALAAEAEQINRHVESLRSLLDRVEHGDMAGRAGFSGYFEALARHVLPDVSLSGIKLENQGQEIELTGAALAAEQVPRLAQALGQEAAFAAKHFAELRLNRPNSPTAQVDFVLSTANRE